MEQGSDLRSWDCAFEPHPTWREPPWSPLSTPPAGRGHGVEMPSEQAQVSQPRLGGWGEVTETVGGDPSNSTLEGFVAVPNQTDTKPCGCATGADPIGPGYETLSVFWASWALPASHAGVAWERRQGFLLFLLTGIRWQSLDLRESDTWSPCGGGHTLGQKEIRPGASGKGFPPWSPHCLGQPTTSRVQMPGAWLPSCDQEAARPVQPGGRNRKPERTLRT